MCAGLPDFMADRFERVPGQGPTDLPQPRILVAEGKEVGREGYPPSGPCQCPDTRPGLAVGSRAGGAVGDDSEAVGDVPLLSLCVHAIHHAYPLACCRHLCSSFSLCLCVAHSECRERWGQYSCDGRRPISETMKEFPDFDFSKIEVGRYHSGICTPHPQLASSQAAAATDGHQSGSSQPAPYLACMPGRESSLPAINPWREGRSWRRHTQWRRRGWPVAGAAVGRRASQVHG